MGSPPDIVKTAAGIELIDYSLIDGFSISSDNLFFIWLISFCIKVIFVLISVPYLNFTFIFDVSELDVEEYLQLF